MVDNEFSESFHSLDSLIAASLFPDVKDTGQGCGILNSSTGGGDADKCGAEVNAGINTPAWHDEVASEQLRGHDYVHPLRQYSTDTPCRGGIGIWLVSALRVICCQSLPGVMGFPSFAFLCSCVHRSVDIIVGIRWHPASR